MAKIVGQVESLKSLRTELNKRNIHRFNSVGDIKRFIREFTIEKHDILKSHEDLLNEEVKQRSNRILENENKLELAKDEEHTKLNTRIDNYKERSLILEQRSSSLIGRIIGYFKLKKLKRKIAYLQDNFDLIINNSVRGIKTEIFQDSNRVKYISENKQKLIRENSRGEIDKIDSAKKTIEELGNLIAGAIGENLVEKEIGKLSDDYVLINDYKMEFKPPIYNKKTNDRIFSIQIDHLLVSRSGIFILETKNWSDKSINSLDLRSPVDQIMRTSYALFIVANKQIQLNKHHWGEKQIPIRNIIVMINHKPKSEFKHVKIKQLRELNSYVEYFDPIFSKNEANNIANQLVKNLN